MFGASAELRFRLVARFEPRDEFVTGLYRGHIDLVARHEGPGKIGRDLKHAAAQRAMQRGHARLGECFDLTGTYHGHDGNRRHRAGGRFAVWKATDTLLGSYFVLWRSRRMLYCFAQ
jgi:hypothetical protein